MSFEYLLTRLPMVDKQTNKIFRGHFPHIQATVPDIQAVFGLLLYV